MPAQNLKNHSRILLLWHIITPLIMLAVVAGSIIFYYHTAKEGRLPALLLTGISFVLLVLWGYSRYFALRAQDRAIRAEENFRHYILTGKPHDARLRLDQIIALRFAADEEMPGLAIRAIEEKLSQKQIKVAIYKWRPDYYRV